MFDQLFLICTMLQADEANDAEERAAGNHEEEAIDRGRELGEQGDIEHDAVRADENVDHDHVEGEEGDDQQFREIEVKFQFSKHPIGDPSRFSEIGALVKACRDNTRSDDAFWDAVAEFLLHYVICLSVHKAATQNPRMTGAAYKSLVDKNAELNCNTLPLKAAFVDGVLSIMHEYLGDAVRPAANAEARELWPPRFLRTFDAFRNKAVPPSYSSRSNKQLSAVEWKQIFTGERMHEMFNKAKAKITKLNKYYDTPIPSGYSKAYKPCSSTNLIYSTFRISFGKFICHQI